MGSPDEGLKTRQHEVQRLLGQCVLRLQAYELIMKEIVAHHDFSGSAQSLGEAQGIRSTDIGRKTLGTLVNHLLDSFLTTEGKQMLSEKQQERLENTPAFRVHQQLELSADDFARAEKGLKELVLLRNNLVHHFLDLHDLGSIDGCRAAEAALIEASGQIKDHCDELRQWAEEFQETRARIAEVIQSDAFRDFMVEDKIPWPSPQS